MKMRAGLTQTYTPSIPIYKLETITLSIPFKTRLKVEHFRCLLEMYQKLDSKKDICKNQELFELVEEYFDNCLKSLDFLVAV